MSTDSRGKSAFTLIEVLAAMAVLLILMMLLMRIFNESVDAFEKGHNVAMRNASARSALDLIAEDLEGLVVDSKAAMYKISDTVDINYDEIFFVTTTGDTSSDPRARRTYQLVHYYVSTNIPEGKSYRPFRLMRGIVDLNTAVSGGVDPLAEDKDWWDNINMDNDIVIENVVRFDVYVCTTNNVAISTGGDTYNMGGADSYDSTVNFVGSDPAANLPADTPPAYIDIYLQVATDDAMQQFDRTIRAHDQGFGGELRAKAYGVLYRNSNVLLTRITPIMGYAQQKHPLSRY